MVSVKDYLSQVFISHGVACSLIKPSYTRISPETAHGKLPRPALKDLPPLHTEYSAFCVTETERLYRAFYAGNCYMLWKHEFDQPIGLVYCRPSIHLWLSLEEPKGLAVNQNMQYGFKIMSEISDDDDIVIDVIDCRIGHEPSPLLGITEDHRYILRARYMHVLLRLCGFDLGIRSMKYLELCQQCYQTLDWWKELADVAIVLADIRVEAKQPGDWICASLRQVAEALLICKQYEISVDIYQQLIDEYTVNNVLKQVRYNFSQGDNYLLGELLDKATSKYFLAFRLLHGNLGDETIHSDDFRGIVGRIAMLFNVKGCRETERGWTEFRTTGRLVGLCSNVFDAMPADAYLLPRLFATHFRTPMIARKSVCVALQAAIAQPTEKLAVKKFCSTVCSWT
jgi:hypothetical protein